MKLKEIEEQLHEIMKFMAKGVHPHCEIRITSQNAELVEGVENIVLEPPQDFEAVDNKQRDSHE